MTRFGSSVFDEGLEVVKFFVELWYNRHVVLHHIWVPGSIVIFYLDPGVEGSTGLTYIMAISYYINYSPLILVLLEYLIKFANELRYVNYFTYSYLFISLRM